MNTARVSCAGHEPPLRLNRRLKKEMKRTTSRLAFLTFVSALGFAQLTWGDVSFTINGVNGNSLGGVYTDPYSASINGGASVAAFCDDFIDNVSVPETWTATDTNLSQFDGSTPVTTVLFSVNGGNTYTFNSLPPRPPITATQTQEYIAAAILAEEGLNTYATDSAAANDYSFALWGLFDPSLLASTDSPDGSISPTDLQIAQQDLLDALILAKTQYTSGQDYENKTGLTVNIYTPTSWDGQTPGPINTRPQEFITIRMDESPSFGIYAADLLGAGMLCYFFRRRIVASR
jgi:hypothetical protein